MRSVILIRGEVFFQGMGKELVRWRAQAMAATASLHEAKKELLLRKKETEDTLGKMDTLFEKLVVGRDKGAELQSNIEFYMQSVMDSEATAMQRRAARGGGGERAPPSRPAAVAGGGAGVTKLPAVGISNGVVSGAGRVQRVPSHAGSVTHSVDGHDSPAPPGGKSRVAAGLKAGPPTRSKGGGGVKPQAAGRPPVKAAKVPVNESFDSVTHSFDGYPAAVEMEASVHSVPVEEATPKLRQTSNAKPKRPPPGRPIPPARR